MQVLCLRSKIFFFIQKCYPICQIQRSGLCGNLDILLLCLHLNCKSSQESLLVKGFIQASESVRNSIHMQKVLIILIVTLVTLPLFAQEEAVIRGTVVDSGKVILPGATVHLQKKGETSEQIIYTGGEGTFEFPGVKKGLYTLTVELSGFQTVTAEINIETSGMHPLQIVLPLEQKVQEAVTVSGEGTPLLNREETQKKNEITGQTLDLAPVQSERFQDVLPLVPSVVRGPDGLININGARATESSLLVNGANVTDPVTGNFAVELPYEAVDSVQVYTNPYSAEYGKFSGGVTNVSTKSGSDKLKVEFNDFLPRFHTEGWRTEGVEAWTPRLRVSGPTGYKNLYFSQAVQYKFNRTFLGPDLKDNNDFMQLSGFDTLTQLDYKQSNKHQLTFTVSAFPEKIENLNLNTFLPEASTPDFKQSGYNIAGFDRYFFHAGQFLESSFSVKEYDVKVTPKETDVESPFLITTEGYRGNYFNDQDRDSRRYQWTEAFTFKPFKAGGPHVLRSGVDFAKTDYSGTLDYTPVEIRGTSGQLLERIDYTDGGNLGKNSQEISAYVQDHWSPDDELNIDWGLRLDYDSISQQQNFGPRFSFAYAPKLLPKTVFKGGIGKFYDKVFLNASDFDKYPDRIISQYDDSGRLLERFLQINRFDGDIKTPRSTTWNLEADQELTPKIVLRTNFLSRHGKDQFVLNPTRNELLLSNDGTSRYWEWELTSEYRLSKESNVYFSYVRSNTRGDTNDFDTYFGNFQRPIIREDVFARLSFDTPNRYLFWGVVKSPFDVYFSPLLEIRNGFPYSAVDQAQQFVGERNSERFPNFAQLDMRITRAFTVFDKYKLTAGLKIFNVLNNFNPRDVQNNIDNPSFGTFYNSVGRMFRIAFEIAY
jgi:outer membrane receptor protein involved in Fe transport